MCETVAAYYRRDGGNRARNIRSRCLVPPVDCVWHIGCRMPWGFSTRILTSAKGYTTLGAVFSW